MPLNNMQCQSAKPKFKMYKLFDFEGLYLQVEPNGRKYWRFKYRHQSKEKCLALGVYPQITLLDARKQKDAFREQLRNGFDPALVKKEQQQLASLSAEETFEPLAREWFAKNEPQWEPRYAKTVMHRLEKYVFPDLGSYIAKHVKPLVVLACIQRIEKTAPEMARRMKQLVSHIFKYGIATGRCESDPTYGLEAALKKYKKGHFKSIDIEDVPDFMLALHNHTARLYRQTYLAIKLILLTAVRVQELIHAQWPEFNFEKQLWTIPASRMKMKRPHLVPLSKQAVELLFELKEMNGKHKFVFLAFQK